MRRKRSSATGNRRHSIRGFTLLELVVVIAIMAVMLAITVPAMQGQYRSSMQQRETARLFAVLRAVRQDAIIDGREWGMSLDDGGYGFLTLDPDTRRWVARDEPPTRYYRLPPTLSLTLKVQTEAATAGIDNEQKPVIFLLSSGITSAFVMEVRSAGQSFPAVTLISDGHTDIRMAGQ